MTKPKMVRIQTSCIRCGRTRDQVGASGSYLERVSPKGEAFRGRCSEGCDDGDELMTPVVIAKIRGLRQAKKG